MSGHIQDHRDTAAAAKLEADCDERQATVVGNSRRDRRGEVTAHTGSLCLMDNVPSGPGAYRSDLQAVVGLELPAFQAIPAADEVADRLDGDDPVFSAVAIQHSRSRADIDREDVVGDIWPVCADDSPVLEIEANGRIMVEPGTGKI